MVGACVVSAFLFLDPYYWFSTVQMAGGEVDLLQNLTSGMSTILLPASLTTYDRTTHKLEEN